MWYFKPLLFNAGIENRNYENIINKKILLFAININIVRKRKKREKTQGK